MEYLPVKLPGRLRELSQHAMLRVVKNAVGIQRPMSASGRLKAEEGAYGKVGNSLRLLSFMVEFDSMISQHVLHFAQVGFTVVAEITADVFGSRSQQHRKDRLTCGKTSSTEECT